MQNITKEDLKNLRKKMGITQTELGNLLGVALQTVQNWEGGKKISSTKEKKIQELISQSINYSNAKLANKENYKFYEIPFISVKAYASFTGHSDSDCFNFVDEPIIKYLSETDPMKNQVVIEIYGDSMLPTLKDKSRVTAICVNQADWIHANPGLYGIAFRNQFVVKRIKKNTLLEDKKIELFSDSELHGSVVVYGEDIRAMFEIISIQYQNLKN